MENLACCEQLIAFVEQKIKDDNHNWDWKAILERLKVLKFELKT